MLGMNIITSSIPPFHGYGRCEQIFTLFFSSVCEESLPRPNILFPREAHRTCCPLCCWEWVAASCQTNCPLDHHMLRALPPVFSELRVGRFEPSQCMAKMHLGQLQLLVQVGVAPFAATVHRSVGSSTRPPFGSANAQAAHSLSWLTEGGSSCSAGPSTEPTGTAGAQAGTSLERVKGDVAWSFTASRSGARCPF